MDHSIANKIFDDFSPGAFYFLDLDGQKR